MPARKGQAVVHQDHQIVETARFNNPEPAEGRGFNIRVPQGPFSFSGKLISLLWALEAVAQPGDRAERLPIVVSPTRQEILLPTEPPAE